jgi:phenylacetic acid degradation operon negative regulatory protein
LFGDYWWHVPEQIPSAALVAALGDVGVADAAARATLSRLIRAGILTNGRVGRRTAYALSARGAAIVDAQNEWLEAFGHEESAWTGTWNVVAFSVPEERRSARHQIRSRLRWHGYAPLHDGLWVSASDTEFRAMSELRELGAARVTAMRTKELFTHPDRPQDAWDLSEAAEQYAAFLRQVSGPLPQGGADALRERTRVSLAWQRFRVDDPGLPEELLPADWPRRSARTLFVRRHAALAAGAEERVRAHVSAVDPSLGELVTHRRYAG